MKQIAALVLAITLGINITQAQAPIVPTATELSKAFGQDDKTAFQKPPLVFQPETWFHFIGGNVSLEGITADLEAIAKSGISGIQLFHGEFGGPWPGVSPQMTFMSPAWENAVRHTADECRRLGLRFTMQNCPGWAMSGGPWIKPENAMRQLVWSRTDIIGKRKINEVLEQPQPSGEEWRDYRDIAVLAFPTPADDNGGKPLIPQEASSNREDVSWMPLFAGSSTDGISLSPVPENEPNWVELTFKEPVTVRTVEFSSINGFSHGWCYEPGVNVKVEAVLADGSTQEIVQTAMPQSNWQDDKPISLACTEIAPARVYRVSIANKHQMKLSSLRLLSAARKNNWEAEAGWTLRSIVRANDNPKQSKAAFIDPDQVLDITETMDQAGNIHWNAPKGNWTILRIGNVNTGAKNGPAPAVGTGWECDKLSENGPNVQFANYIGRLSSKNGPVGDGRLNGMLLDSWECKTQTWTANMEAEFSNFAGYELRKWLPAVFGYVLGDQETSAQFLRDWRGVINELFTNKFYGRMATLARENNLAISYETAAGDVFPADIMEYFKYAEVPMCEFWQPYTESYVGSLNFKPIKPTASAARLYGKPRVAAEAFTNMSLSWDEELRMLKEVANGNFIEGVTHPIFHTYTHNPRTDFLPPGTSFGAQIGTPFLRGQTWWQHMPAFTDYMARCSYLLERGKPVSDVLWYLGDEINHKPDQNAAFPEGFKYDYCNPDVLLNHLSVQGNLLSTPEGIRYKVLWLADNQRMLPETLEKMVSLLREGATIIGDAPKSLATLKGGKEAQKRFDAALKAIWGTSPQPGLREVGKGRLVSGMPLEKALQMLKLAPDVIGKEVSWLHRKVKGADWYFVTAPKGGAFQGTVRFHNKGHVELWDPVSGRSMPATATDDGTYTQVTLALPKAAAVFVVFQHERNLEENQLPAQQLDRTIPLIKPWNLTFPSGWGASNLQLTTLKPWKDLELSEEGKAFSGTATYTTSFDIDGIEKDKRFMLDLGQVEDISVVSINGQQVGTRWAQPYVADITDYLKSGQNTVSVKVTSTWFNRLVYDAGQAENKRKTWTINGPPKDAKLKDSGLLGPVQIKVWR